MKHRIVHLLQKYFLNPPIKILFAIGIVPPGYRFWKPLGARRASRGALRWAMGASAISSGSWRNTASKQGTCVIFRRIHAFG